MIVQAMPYPFVGGGGGGGGTDDHFDKVVLLMGFDGADGATDFIDESSYAQTVTVVGSAQKDTADKVFGTASLLSNFGHIHVPDSANFAFGSSDFTIEGFYQPVSNSSHFLWGKAESGFYWNAVYFASNKVNWDMRDLFSRVEAPLIYVVGQKYHICVERAGTIGRIYIDGVMSAKVSLGSGGVADDAHPFRVGAVDSSQTSNGRLDEVRVTKGVARYNSDAGFTVPTAAFPRNGTLPAFTVNPAISSSSGFYGVGDTITTSNGTHNGSSQTYQWKRGGVAIPGETSPSYLLDAADLGALITCTVSATNYAGSTSATSASVGPIVNPTFSTDTRIAPAADTRVTPTGDTRIVQTRTA